MNIFLSINKKRAIIFSALSLLGLMFVISMITFIAPMAHKENLTPLVIIDPGHGGEDGVAVGHNGIV